MNLNSAANALLQTKIMEWTNDDALELIEQYRCHTELWNRADPKYKDKLCRFRAWSEIAERFRCSKAEVERKMNVLLTQYRREKHKMLVKLYQGIQPNPSKWYAFKRFDFMEAGGGSSSSMGGSGSIGGGSNSSGSSGGGTGRGAAVGSVINGHSAMHTNALNGLVPGVEAGTTNSTTAVAATAGTSNSSHHRRLKCKAMKYFDGTGLNLPLLIADSWNAMGQFSPPIVGERNQLRIPLPLSFSASQNELSVPSGSTATQSLFGGSSNSDMTASPQKPMDTGDLDEDNKEEANEETKHEPHTPPASTSHMQDIPGTKGVVVIGSPNTRLTSRIEGNIIRGNSEEMGSSPIPNTNLYEAHKQHNTRLSHPHPHHILREQEELDIKQEQVDYIHASHPPGPPGSHHSYRSADDNRLSGGGGGGGDSGGDANEPGVDFAQDLRISAAAVAAAKSLDFSHFVLPRNLRQSSESIDEKFTPPPLNMRKLNAAAAATNTASAGRMLMSSLLSNESMSEEDLTTGSGRLLKSGGGSQPDTASTAAAAALYTESLNKDDCDFIGSNVTLKLRSMDRTQRIIAEKLISEVLYYGQFNELERSARIHPK